MAENKEYYDNGSLKSVTNTSKGFLGLGHERKDGAYEEYYENGALKEKGRYNNDKKDGVCSAYDKEGNLSEYEYNKGHCNKITSYENGVKKSECHFKSNKDARKYVTFYPSGKKSSEMYSQRSKFDTVVEFSEKTGKMTFSSFEPTYMDENGRIRPEKRECKYYDDNGNIQKSVVRRSAGGENTPNYKNRGNEVLTTNYDSNGKISAEKIQVVSPGVQSFSQKIPEFVYTEFNVKRETDILGNATFIKDGLEKTWARPESALRASFKGDVLEGILSSEINYKDGERHGEAKFFYPDGSLRRETEYKNGREDGTATFYAPGSKNIPAGNETFAKGVLVKRAEFGKDDINPFVVTENIVFYDNDGNPSGKPLVRYAGIGVPGKHPFNEESKQEVKEEINPAIMAKLSKTR